MANATPVTSQTTPRTVQRRFNGRQAFWLGLGLLVLAFGFFSWLLFQPSGNNGAINLLPIGKAAPSFTLTNSQGTPVTLSQLHGHPLMINFWSTTCGPCQSETPLLQRTYTQYKSQGFLVLGVSETDPLSSVIQFGNNYALTYPLLPDLHRKVNDRYGVTGLPVSYFIDAQGIIRYTVNGALTPQTLQYGLRTIGLSA